MRRESGFAAMRQRSATTPDQKDVAVAGLWLPLICEEGERECFLERKCASLRVKGRKGILAEACA